MLCAVECNVRVREEGAKMPNRPEGGGTDCGRVSKILDTPESLYSRKQAVRRQRVIRLQKTLES